MKVLWLLPSRPAGTPSGGDLYGSQVREGLRLLGHQVEASTALPSDVRADVIVQDELGFRTFLPFNRALDRAGNRARRIALVHVTTARLQPGKKSAGAEARFLASTHQAVFVSEQARAESFRLLALPRSKGAVISPGADRLPLVRRPKAKAHARLRLLCVAHLLPQKGQLALLQAFAGLERLDASLLLVGDGTLDRPYTARVCRQLQRVRSAGWLGPLQGDALARQLARADVFINASEYESWGMAAAEAQRAGLPVVSWSKGGLWEFLTPGVDSLRARAPSAAVLERLHDDALVARLARGAREAPVRTGQQGVREFAALLKASVT